MAIEMQSFEHSSRPWRERRSEPVDGNAESPAALVSLWVRNAERQLLAAREDLKAARRRVVQLEDVVTSWRQLASDVSTARPRVGSAHS